MLPGQREDSPSSAELPPTSNFLSEVDPVPPTPCTSRVVSFEKQAKWYHRSFELILQL